LLDQEDLADLVGEVDEFERRKSWTSDTELLATAVDMLAHIAARLDSGIATQWVKQVKAVPKQKPLERPEWIVAQRKTSEIVMHPRDFFRHIQKNDNKK